MGDRPQTNQQNDTGNLDETNHARRRELEKAIINTHQGWRGCTHRNRMHEKKPLQMKIGS